MTAIGIGLSPVLGRSVAGGLAAPANLALSITGASKDVITATWDAVSGAATYEVEYSDDGVTYAPVDTTALLTYGVTSTDYNVDAVTHYIRVRATGGAWATADISGLLIGLIAYWRMDEASGTRADIIGSNDLADTNTVGSAAGLLGTAADFEASNSEYLSNGLPTGLDLPTSYTIDCYIRPEAVGGIQILHKRENAAQITIYLNGNQAALYTDAQVLSTPTLANGSDYHVAVARDGTTTASVWVNNVETTGTMAGTNTPLSASLFVGQDNAGANFYDGLMQHMAVWRRTLSDAQIAKRYNGGAGFDPTA